jgi:hypothetical protein
MRIHQSAQWFVQRLSPSAESLSSVAGRHPSSSHPAIDGSNGDCTQFKVQSGVTVYLVEQSAHQQWMFVTNAVPRLPDFKSATTIASCADTTQRSR